MVVEAGFKPARNKIHNQTENSVIYNIRRLENHKQVCVRKLPNGENINMGEH